MWSSADRGDEAGRDNHLTRTPCGVGVADAVNLAKHADLLDELVRVCLEARNRANLLINLAIGNKGLQQQESSREASEQVGRSRYNAAYIL